VSAPKKLKPTPLRDGHSERYWDAARRGTLLIQRCAACGAYQFYPRRHCTRCFASDPEWIAASGRGTLHTFSIVERSTNPEFADDCPYVFAIVELEEGVRMATRIVDADRDRLVCDAAVTVTWQIGTEGAPRLPVFVLEETQE
jgi:uncharacterized protein